MNEIQIIKGITKKHDKWNRYLIGNVLVDFRLFGFLIAIDDRAVTVAGNFSNDTFMAYGYIIPGKEDYMLGCDDPDKMDEAFKVLRHLLK